MTRELPSLIAAGPAAGIARDAKTLAAAAPSVLPALVGRDFALTLLWLVDRACGVLRCVAAWPDSPRLDPFRRAARDSVLAPGVGLGGRAWLQRRPSGVLDLAADPNLPGGPLATASGLVSGVAVPVVVAGRVVAVLEGFRHEAAVPAPAHSERLAAAATTLESLLTDGGLPVWDPEPSGRRRSPGRPKPSVGVVDERVRAARLTAVVELGRRALTGTEPSALAAEAVGLAREMLDGDSVVYVEISDDDREFVVRAALGAAAGTVERLVQGGDRSLAGLTLNADAPVTVEDLARDPRLAPDGVVQGFNSGLSAVVSGPSGPFGVMVVLTQRRRRFEGDEVAFLRLVANTLAAGIGRARADDATRGSDALLRAIVDGTTDAVFVKDADGRHLMTNAACARVLGRTPEDIVGLRSADVFPNDVARDISAADAAVMARREWRTYEEQIVTGSGEERVFLTSRGPYLAGDGSVAGVIGIARDITERKRGEDRRRLVSAAGHVLASTHEEQAAVRELAALAVPAMADWCVIELLADSGRIVPAAAAHANDRARLIEELRRRSSDPGGGPAELARMIKAVRPELYQRVEAPPGLSARDDVHLELIRTVGFESAAVVPLLAHGQWLGALTLAVTGRRRYSWGDLAIFEELADSLATALDNARLRRDRDQMGRLLQHTLLPLELPRPPGLELTARFHGVREGSEPAGVFYDAFPAGGACVLVAGDVGGHGSDAAAGVSRVRETLRPAAQWDAAPGSLLRALGAMPRSQADGTRACTAAIARLLPHPGGAAVTLSGSVHRCRAVVEGEDVTAVATFGGAVDVGGSGSPSAEEFDLGPGDALVVHTGAVSGLVGASVPAEAGADALAERIERLVLDAQADRADEPFALLVAQVPASRSQRRTLWSPDAGA